MTRIALGFQLGISFNVLRINGPANGLGGGDRTLSFHGWQAGDLGGSQVDPRWIPGGAQTPRGSAGRLSVSMCNSMEKCLDKLDKS